jgi:hypothetical protein
MCWFNRKGPSGFSGASTAEEVTAGIDARGLVAVITGTIDHMMLPFSLSACFKQLIDISISAMLLS